MLKCTVFIKSVIVIQDKSSSNEPTLCVLFIYFQDDFEKFFTETETQPGIRWQSLFLTAVGLTALAALASVKGST